MSKRQVLYLDDDRPSLDALGAALGEHHVIHGASSVEAALGAIDAHSVEVALVAQQIGSGSASDVDGVDFLCRLRAEYPSVTRVLVANDPDAQTLIRALNDAHVHQVITKPWDTRELGRAVGAAAPSTNTEKNEQALQAELDAARRKLAEHRAALAALQRARAVAQEQMRAFNSELEIRVAERTRDLEAANEALWQSEETFRSVSAAAQSAIVMIGPDGRIGLWNRAAERIFGWTATEVAGRRVDEFLVPLDYRERHAEGFERFQRTGHGAFIGVTAELVALTKRGDEIPIEMSLSSVRRGDQWHAVAILNDITERHRVRRELIQARETAEHANRAKSAFLANMSHEIRTPMNAILGFSQLLRRDPTLGEAHRAKVESILRGGEHLLELINDILAVAHIESGRVVLSPSTFNVRDLLTNVEDMFRPRTAATGVTLSTSVSKLLPPLIRADSRKLQQILVNVVGNAVKFTDDGEIAIHAKVVGIGSDLRFVVDVQDSGGGIDADDLERVFEKFAQTDVGAAKGGTGLGLPISREYARVMNGELTVSSTLGEGTCFHLEIPVATGHVADITPLSSTEAVLGLDPDQDPLRVLVVDDTPADRQVLCELLRGLGFYVREAAGGDEAIAVAAEWLPQLVLMDLRMRGMDGYEATRILKNAYPSTIVIAMSASAFREDRERAIAAGAADFVPKPFREADLIASIRDEAGVTFRFVELSGTVSHTGEVSTTTLAAELARLPETNKKPMRDAVVTGDVDRFLALLAAANVPRAVETKLRRLAEQFDYERVLYLLGPG